MSLRLDSGSAMKARIWMTSAGQEIASTRRIWWRAATWSISKRGSRKAASTLIEVHISSAGAEQVLVSQRVTVRKPHVLYVAGGNETSAPLLDTLKQADVDVEMVTAFPVNHPTRDWDAVLLDNYPDHDLAATRIWQWNDTSTPAAG
jgi:hypothetical protein